MIKTNISLAQKIAVIISGLILSLLVFATTVISVQVNTIVANLISSDNLQIVKARADEVSSSFKCTTRS